MNQTPPQVHLKVRFIEVQQSDNNALGFDWWLGQNMLTNAAVLTDPNFRAALRALQQRKDVDTLGEPEVTTLSGRQTQMRATTVVTVVTNLSTQRPTVSSSGSAVPETASAEIGPVLDVVPYVLADGYTINLALIPSGTQFAGYKFSGYDLPTNHYNFVDPVTTPLPNLSPLFRRWQTVATMNVWDNQTAVITGLDSSGRELLVFVTATIVDSAGRRVHTDEELPFAQTSIPVQPPQKQ